MQPRLLLAPPAKRLQRRVWLTVNNKTLFVILSQYVIVVDALAKSLSTLCCAPQLQWEQQPSPPQPLQMMPAKKTRAQSAARLNQ
jgi:hypothetical protein